MSCTPLLAVEQAPSDALVRTARSDAAAPWEQELAGARARAEAAAHDETLTLLPDLEDLRARWSGGAPVPCALGPRMPSAPDLAALLDEIATVHDVHGPRLVTSGRTGDLAPEETVFGLRRVDSGRVAHRVADGDTVRWPAVDQCSPAVSAVLAPLDALIGARAQLDLVWIGGTWTATSPAAHVLWSLDGAATVSDGGDREVAEIGGTGGAVFAPASVAITVEPSTPLLAADLVLAGPTVGDVARRLAREAVLWPLLRADLPYDPTRPPTSYAGSPFDRPGGLSDALADLVDDASMDRVVARLRADVPARLRTGLHAAMSVADGAPRDAATAVRCPLPTGLVVRVGAEAADDVVRLVGGGVELAVRAHAAVLAARWSDGAEHRVADAPSCPDGDPQCARRLATQLVRAGVLEVVS